MNLLADLPVLWQTATLLALSNVFVTFAWCTLRITWQVQTELAINKKGIFCRQLLIEAQVMKYVAYQGT